MPIPGSGAPSPQCPLEKPARLRRSLSHHEFPRAPGSVAGCRLHPAAFPTHHRSGGCSRRPTDRGDLWPQVRHRPHARRPPTRPDQRLRRDRRHLRWVLFIARRNQPLLHEGDPRSRLYRVRRRAWFPTQVHHPGDHPGHAPVRALDPRPRRRIRRESGQAGRVRRLRRRAPVADARHAGRPRRCRRQGSRRTRLLRRPGRGLLLSPTDFENWSAPATPRWASARSDASSTPPSVPVRKSWRNA